jgi:hypothetical protein
MSVALLHGLATWIAKLDEILHHLSSIGSTMKFTMEMEVNNTLPFSDVFILKRGPKLGTKIYQKPAHTGHYLHFDFNH